MYRRAAPGPVALKESLGEYGSEWGWDSNMYADMPHVVDQSTTQTDSIIVNGVLMLDLPRVYLNGAQSSYCINFLLTDGQVLSSLDQMRYQKSCKPNVYNAGNIYDQNAIAASVLVAGKDGYLQNTICPKGWMISSQNDSTYQGKRSFNYLYKITYGKNELDALSPRPFPLTTNARININNDIYSGVVSPYIIYWSAKFDKNSRPFFLTKTPGGYLTENNYPYIRRDTLASLRCDGRSVLFAASTRLLNKSELSFTGFVSLRRLFGNFLRASIKLML